MAVEGCGLVCKYVLVLFNIIFAIVGVAFLGVGLWLRFGGSTRGIFQEEILDSSAFVIGVTVLVVLGVVLLVLASFGDYGVCSEKLCALQVFSVLLAVLAVAQVVVGILAFTQKEKVGSRMMEFYGSLYHLYVANADVAIATTLTSIHYTLQCCGITGIPLVELVKETCPKAEGFLAQFTTPSCPRAINDVFVSKASVVTAVFCGIAALLVIALVCSVILQKHVRKVQHAITSYYNHVY